MGRGIMAPRQPQPLHPAVASGPTAIGVSAFAFQGTNAHVLMHTTSSGKAAGVATTAANAGQGLKGPNGTAGRASAAQLPWQRTRSWPHLVTSPLLYSVLPVAGPGRARRGAALRTLHFECLPPAGEAHAALWQHVVCGLPLVPAAALAELALGCASAALSPAAATAAAAYGHAHGQALQLQLVGVSIPLPCVLPTEGAPTKHAEAGWARPLLVCSLDLVSGALQVRAQASNAVHLTASVAVAAGRPLSRHGSGVSPGSGEAADPRIGFTVGGHGMRRHAVARRRVLCWALAAGAAMRQALLPCAFASVAVPPGVDACSAGVSRSPAQVSAPHPFDEVRSYA